MMVVSSHSGASGLGSTRRIRDSSFLFSWMKAIGWPSCDFTLCTRNVGNREKLHHAQAGRTGNDTDVVAFHQGLRSLLDCGIEHLVFDVDSVVALSAGAETLPITQPKRRNAARFRLVVRCRSSTPLRRERQCGGPIGIDDIQQLVLVVLAMNKGDKQASSSLPQHVPRIRAERL